LRVNYSLIKGELWLINGRNILSYLKQLLSYDIYAIEIFGFLSLMLLNISSIHSPPLVQDWVAVATI